MALPDSALSRACRSIADHVRVELAAAGVEVQTRIGSPWAAQPAQTTTEHALNFFFHRIEPAGFGPDTLPGEPWWMRVHCVVTSFAVAEERVSAGENDLRLIGEVIRIFHEAPVLDAIDVGGEVMQAQVVFEPLSLDDVNRLWSTQKDVAYRLSVGYEIALAPIVPRRRAVEPRRVGAVTAEVRAGAARETVGVGPLPLPAPSKGEGWAPQIAFATARGPAQVLSLVVGSDELARLRPRVMIAGEKGAPVTLAWEVWDRARGFLESGATVSAAARFAALPEGSVAEADTTRVDLPFTDAAGQALLHARRTYVRAADGASITVRSNPLLVTLVGRAP